MNESKMREALEQVLNTALKYKLEESDMCVELAREALDQPADVGLTDCLWAAHEDVYMPNTFDGSCGARWSFIDGDTIGNGLRFCPYCGGRVVSKPVKGDTL